MTTQTSLGVNVSGYSEFERGWIRPSVDLAWWHAFDDDNGYGVGLAAPGLLNSFEVLTNDVNGDRLVIQAGGEFGFGTSEAWTLNAGYLGVYGGDGYTSHGGSFGAQVEF